MCKLRIVHLVTSNTTFNVIDAYLEFQKQTRCQFTVKELVGFSDSGMYPKIRSKYPNIYNLDAGDYNIYWMPDNTEQTEFLY